MPMRKAMRISMLAVVAALLCPSLAQAAPWSFDPERYLASLSDEARCTVDMDGPEMTGSIAAESGEPDAEAAEER
jgi:hypothetical protein